MKEFGKSEFQKLKNLYKYVHTYVYYEVYQKI